MGKTFGIIALIFSVIGVVVFLLALIVINMLIMMSPFILIYSSIPLPLMIAIDIIPIICIIVAIVCGAIGIKKDDSPGLSIAGLIIGTIGAIPYIIAVIMIIVNSGAPLF
ncbi:MAG: hypothetical protein ACFFBH_12235 [Promethearchaeota archaeon]